MKDELSINITIADRRYPMKIMRNDEEKIRKAAKLINERILQYQERYQGKDNQDFLAMSALQLATQLFDLMQENDKEPLLEQIGEISREIDHYLSTL